MFMKIINTKFRIVNLGKNEKTNIERERQNISMDIKSSLFLFVI